MIQKKIRSAAVAALATVGMVVAGLFGAPAAFADTQPEIGHSSNIVKNDDGSYTLNYDISGQAMDETIGGEGADVIVLEDISWSMYGDRWNIAKTATKSLANELLNGKNDIRMSLVAFSNIAETVMMGDSPWTTDPTEVATALDNLKLINNTNWEAAFINAKFLMEGNSNRKTYVVMMSDGQPNAVSTCDPIQANCATYNIYLDNTIDYNRAVDMATSLTNAQIYSVATATGSTVKMQDLVNDINATNPVYPAQYFDGTNQNSLNASFEIIAEDILKRFTNVSIETKLSEYVEPALEAGITDPIEAVSLSQNAVDAGATVSYNEETGNFNVKFPEGMEITDTYTLSIRIRPTQAGIELSATAEGNAISTGSSEISYQLATTVNGQTELSEVHTATQEGALLVVEQAVEPEPTPEPTEPTPEPVEPTTPAEPETPAAPAQSTPAAPSQQIASTGSAVSVVAAVAVVLMAAGATILTVAKRRVK